MDRLSLILVRILRCPSNVRPCALALCTAGGYSGESRGQRLRGAMHSPTRARGGRWRQRRERGGVRGAAVGRRHAVGAVPRRRRRRRTRHRPRRAGGAAIGLRLGHSMDRARRHSSTGCVPLAILGYISPLSSIAIFKHTEIFQYIFQT